MTIQQYDSYSPFDPSHEIFRGNMNQQEHIYHTHFPCTVHIYLQPYYQQCLHLQSHDIAEQVN